MGGGAAGGLWRHQQWSLSWPPSWILPRIRNQVKAARNSIFVLYMKNNTSINTLQAFSHKIYHYCWKKLKKYVISPKIGLFSCYLWRLSRNHSNWPSLNVSQNLRKGWTNSYWKRQVLMFYPLGKKLRETSWGEGGVVIHPAQEQWVVTWVFLLNC